MISVLQLEQSNERLAEELSHQYYLLDQLYKGIHKVYEIINAQSLKTSVEERALLLLELSRYALLLRNDNQNKLTEINQLLDNNKNLKFAKLLKIVIESDSYAAQKQLQIG